jgi:hypothetical protein
MHIYALCKSRKKAYRRGKIIKSEKQKEEGK